mmetsp:Transcript_1489/g.5856  ORF Transcript_1489/g.5856 Transcript_1489/m.5856 type:complete len:207 (+) Transcript_1489:429-1049(+)
MRRVAAAARRGPAGQDARQDQVLRAAHVPGRPEARRRPIGPDRVGELRVGLNGKDQHALPLCGGGRRGRRLVRGQGRLLRGGHHLAQVHQGVAADCLRAAAACGAQDEDRVHHGPQMLGRGDARESHARGHERGALQLLTRRSRGPRRRHGPRACRGRARKPAARRPARHQGPRDPHGDAEGSQGHRDRGGSDGDRRGGRGGVHEL